MPEKRRRFDREFREGAVRIVRETNKPVAQVAADLGINPGTLGNWVNQDKVNRGEVERLSGDETRRAGAVASRERRAADGTGCPQAIGGPVGEGGDAVSLAAFIADQRTSHRVPHTVACRALNVSVSWFYKWQHRPRRPTPTQQRRAELDAAVAEAFAAAQGRHGSPRVVVDLRAAGWVVSEKSVAKSMARQGLVARPKKRRKNLTRPDKRAVPFPDLVQRDFTALSPNVKWVGDMTEIPTDEGKLYLSTAIDLFSRRLLGYATSAHPDAELAGQTIKMAVTARGGKDRWPG
jgi:hypothetical protein